MNTLGAGRKLRTNERDELRSRKFIEHLKVCNLYVRGRLNWDGCSRKEAVEPDSHSIKLSERTRNQLFTG